jgi:beta-lactam-binding protein with PASTA domain
MYGMLNARFVALIALFAGCAIFLGGSLPEANAAKGRKTYAVPDVVGLSQENAETAIRSTRLAVGDVSQAVSDTVPAGDVISQDPASGTEVYSKTPVNLVVSVGATLPDQVAVPTVTGLAQFDAEIALANAGLVVGEILEEYSDAVAAGDVINQDPAGGVEVSAGSSVDLTVSLGSAPPAEPVDAPDLVGLSQSKAQNALSAVGLTVGAVSNAYSATARKGLVVAQNPAPGTSLEAGSAVALFVSVGRKDVPAPNVVGLAQAEAETLIGWTGLTVGVLSEIYSSSAPVGEVVGQNPAAGTIVSGASAVDMSISKGPEPVAVPDLTGMTRSQAESALSYVGLVRGSIYNVYSDTIPVGEVLGQDPAPGTMLLPGGVVSLSLSRGPQPVAVPDLTGMTQEQVSAALVEAGLHWQQLTYVYHPTVPDGLVLSQTPAPGTLILPGSDVSVTMSKGPQPIWLPNLANMTQAEAEAALNSIGLVLGAVTEEYSQTVPEGLVISQDPPMGTLLYPGDAASLVISGGTGYVAVPDLSGMTQVEAEAALTRVSLGLGALSEEYSANVPAGQVISQDPVADEMVLPESAVALNISKGYAAATVPDLSGMTQAEAEVALVASNLQIGAVKSGYIAAIPAGQTYAQIPEAGTIILAGSEVEVWSSLGAPVPSWELIHDGGGDENAFDFPEKAICAMVDRWGDIVISSKTVDAADNSDLYMVKIGADGVIAPGWYGEFELWEYIFWGPEGSTEEPYAMCYQDDAYLIAGYVDDPSRGEQGASVWVMHEMLDEMGGAYYPNTGKAKSIFPKADGGFIIAADVVVETNYYLDEEARHDLGTPIVKCVPTSDGGYVTMNNPTGANQTFVSKYNAQWVLQWEALPVIPITMVTDIEPSSDGGVFVAGMYAYDGNGNAEDAWNIVRLDANGAIVWTSNHETGRYGTQDILTTVDGGLLALGNVEDDPTGIDTDLRCVKFDANGRIEHNFTMGGNFKDWPGSILEMPDGSYVVTGVYQTEQDGPYDIYAAKITLPASTL